MITGTARGSPSRGYGRGYPRSRPRSRLIGKNAAACSPPGRRTDEQTASAAVGSLPMRGGLDAGRSGARSVSATSRRGGAVHRCSLRGERSPRSRRRPVSTGAVVTTGKPQVVRSFALPRPGYRLSRRRCHDLRTTGGRFLKIDQASSYRSAETTMS